MKTVPSSEIRQILATVPELPALAELDSIERGWLLRRESVAALSSPRS